MLASGGPPAFGRPDPSSRLIARTVMSASHVIWHERRTPVRPFIASTFFSAAVIFDGSPATNSTRHVVQRALPPQACSTSTCASCSIAFTSRLPAGTSTVLNPSTVSLGIRNSTSLLAPESDPFSDGWRRRHQFVNRLKHHLELRIVFLLEPIDLPREIGVRRERPAKPHKGPHDMNVHMDGATTSQHARQHRDTLLCKRVGQTATAAAR